MRLPNFFLNATPDPIKIIIWIITSRKSCSDNQIDQEKRTQALHF